MSEMNEVLQTLANKLNGLDLTEEEEAALEYLITQSGQEAEVGGFGMGGDPTVIRGLGLFPSRSWSTSGDADDRPTEEVAFYYNKIAFGG